MIMALVFGCVALGLFGMAIVQITKARWAMVALFAVLAFAFAGAAGTFAAAA